MGLNKAVDGSTRLPEHSYTSKMGVGNELGKSHDCLKDWRVRRRERAMLELFTKSTSDNDQSRNSKNRNGIEEAPSTALWTETAEARITKDSSRKLKDLLLEKEREGEGEQWALLYVWKSGRRARSGEGSKLNGG